ncbi:unnamed protein product [Macrosiphum euphorbiae]|uniref:Uncharacterized protein n=1 Tax=Macrosiphum euphorbiae TaxID=13131 RepID=A0AAV0XM84_9HEMI|nr:unnamed protein product [Macrosiphum euphorbiae]
MAVMHESIDDPQLVAAANVFVDDIIETAKVEAAQRTMTKCNGGSHLFESNIKKINEWQNRAKGVFRRFMTTICVRFQDLTSK